MGQIIGLSELASKHIQIFHLISITLTVTKIYMDDRNVTATGRTIQCIYESKNLQKINHRQCIFALQN